MSTVNDRFQQKLDLLTRKWWFYLVLLLFTFIPPYVEKGYNPERIPDVIEAVLRHPFIYEVSPIFVVTKLLPVFFIFLLFVFRNKFRSLFYLYFTALLFAIAVFQNSAITKHYGLVLLVGNILLMSIVGLSWLWECFALKGDHVRAEGYMARLCLAQISPYGKTSYTRKPYTQLVAL